MPGLAGQFCQMESALRRHDDFRTEGSILIFALSKLWCARCLNRSDLPRHLRCADLKRLHTISAGHLLPTLWWVLERLCSHGVSCEQEYEVTYLCRFSHCPVEYCSTKRNKHETLLIYRYLRKKGKGFHKGKFNSLESERSVCIDLSSIPSPLAVGVVTDAHNYCVFRWKARQIAIQIAILAKKRGFWLKVNSMVGAGGDLFIAVHCRLQ